MSQREFDVVESEPAQFSQFDRFSALTIRVAESVWCSDRYDSPLPGTVSRANRKELHDILFVAVVGGIVEPPVWNEGVRVTEVSRRCIGAVVVDSNDGLGVKNVSNYKTPGFGDLGKDGQGVLTV